MCRRDSGVSGSPRRKSRRSPSKSSKSPKRRHSGRDRSSRERRDSHRDRGRPQAPRSAGTKDRAEEAGLADKAAEELPAAPPMAVELQMSPVTPRDSDQDLQFDPLKGRSSLHPPLCP